MTPGLPGRDESAKGDAGLLVGMAEGKPIAVLGRTAAAGAKSPVPSRPSRRTITFDGVDDNCGLVQLAGERGNQQTSIPLEMLGFKPEPCGEVNADVGLLRGDDSQAARRVHRQDKAAGPTADVPGEAMPTPDLRGRRRSVAEKADGEDGPRGQGRRQSFPRRAYIPGSCLRSSARTNG